MKRPVAVRLAHDAGLGGIERPSRNPVVGADISNSWGFKVGDNGASRVGDFILVWPDEGCSKPFSLWSASLFLAAGLSTIPVAEQRQTDLPELAENTSWGKALSGGYTPDPSSGQNEDAKPVGASKLN